MCDCLVALPPVTPGPTLFAKNSDRPPGEAQTIEWLPPRVDEGPVRTTYIEVEPASTETVGVLVSRPWWLWGVEHGVNQAGVVIGNETIFTTDDPRRHPPALVGMDLVRLGLERATTAGEAVEVITVLLERYGQGGSGHHGADHPYWSSFLVADSAAAWVVETSARQWQAEEVEVTRAISNRTTIPEFDSAHRHPRQPVEVLVDPRWEASKAVLARRPVSVEMLEAHLRSHVGEEGYTVCMHAGDDQATTASMVAAVGGAGAPAVAHMLLGWPCRSVYVPLVVGYPAGDVPAWSRFAGLQPEHRRLLDELEQELAADVALDRDWNAEAWRRVEARLVELGL